MKILIHHTSLSNFAGVPAVTRLSRFLFGFSARRGSLCFDPSMSQESMATLLGMNRATIVRALRELKDKGVIKRSTKHSIEINDFELLRKFAEY